MEHHCGRMRFPPVAIENTVGPDRASSGWPVTPFKTVICPPLGNVCLLLKRIVASSLAALYDTVKFVIG